MKKPIFRKPRGLGRAAEAPGKKDQQVPAEKLQITSRTPGFTGRGCRQLCSSGLPSKSAGSPSPVIPCIPLRADPGACCLSDSCQSLLRPTSQRAGALCQRVSGWWRNRPAEKPALAKPAEELSRGALLRKPELSKESIRLRLDLERALFGRPFFVAVASGRSGGRLQSHGCSFGGSEQCFTQCLD